MGLLSLTRALFISLTAVPLMAATNTLNQVPNPVSEQAPNHYSVDRGTGYPAAPSPPPQPPPGFFSQGEILEKSQLNLGKGAPYVMITAPGQSHEQPQPPDEDSRTAVIPVNPVPAKPAWPATPGENPAPLIRTQPGFGPGIQAENRLGPGPAPGLVKDQDAGLPPPPNQYTPPVEDDYPTAGQLDRQYQKAGKLPFDQWGQEPAETMAAPIDFQLAPAPSLYDYPQPNRYYQGSGKSNFLSSYPALKPVLNPAKPQQRFMHAPYANDLYDTEPYDRHWADAPLTPPANLDLQHFEQFPVPRDLYGNAAPISAQPHNTDHYFKPVPAEEIIYPPNYPGPK